MHCGILRVKDYLSQLSCAHLGFLGPSVTCMSYCGHDQSLKNTNLGFSHEAGSGIQSLRVVFSQLFLSPHLQPRLSKIKG